MPHRRDEIALWVILLIISILCDDISTDDKVLQEKDFFWCIERTSHVIWLHVSLIECFTDNGTKVFRLEKMVYLTGWIHSVGGLFFSYDSTLAWHLIEDYLDIFLYVFYLTLHALISFTDTLELHLEDERHRIEKEWHIEYRISHREYLPCYRHRYQIAKSYGRSGNDCEIKCIKVGLSYRMSVLECMYEYRADEPAHDEYDTDSYEFPMMEM